MIKIRTKFPDKLVACQTANRKDHSLSAIFIIYSIFSKRSQMSLFSNKAYNKLITMTGKKKWDALWWAIAILFLNWQSSISRQIHHVFMCTCMSQYLIDEKWKIKYKEVAVVGALPNMQTFFTPPQSDPNWDVPWMFRILI